MQINLKDVPLYLKKSKKYINAKEKGYKEVDYYYMKKDNNINNREDFIFFAKTCLSWNLNIEKVLSESLFNYMKYNYQFCIKTLTKIDKDFFDLTIQNLEALDYEIKIDFEYIKKSKVLNTIIYFYYKNDIYYTFKKSLHDYDEDFLIISEKIKNNNKTEHILSNLQIHNNLLQNKIIVHPFFIEFITEMTHKEKKVDFLYFENTSTIKYSIYNKNDIIEIFKIADEEANNNIKIVRKKLEEKSQKLLLSAQKHMKEDSEEN